MLSREALLGSAGFFEGRVASFEVEGTLARLKVGVNLWMKYRKNWQEPPRRSVVEIRSG